MKLRQWYAQRGAEFVRRRATSLLSRYGLTDAKARRRILSCIAVMDEYGCAPTFPTPGRIVQRYSPFICDLQAAGAEIAVHSHDHVDLRAYTPAEASEQLVRAATVFERNGIEVHGFRCPYLSCTEELLDELPRGLFEYSSNQAIHWDAIASGDVDSGGTVFSTIGRFYRPWSAVDRVCVPRMFDYTVEIPVCVPDDLQLHDGLHLDPVGIARVWSDMLRQTHRRGELFTLLFHPELAACCEQILAAVLQEAQSLDPPVWLARLQDISAWWREKADFSTVVSSTLDGLHISFACSDRATILARGIDTCDPEHVRDGRYCELQTRALDAPINVRPFIGLSAEVPGDTISFLREQGYILDTGETATNCATYIDADRLAGVTSEVELVQYIEASTGPLVRYGRWPSGTQSAMCVSGDLDALTLFDYASRLFVR